MFAMPKSTKNRWVAFALCLFLGIFGAHYFYTGRIGMGILYLFTGGLVGIGWIIDMIRILNGTFVDQTGFPLR